MSLDDILEGLPPEMIKHLMASHPAAKGSVEDGGSVTDEDDDR